MSLQLQIATHSEIGPVRKNNQDSGYASAHLLVVADGMGGAAAGDLASAVAVDTIRKVDAPLTGEQMLEVLAGAMHKANDRIADLVDADYSLEGMGTTVTGVLFDGTQFGLAHIGDSRAYLMHDGHLERLTHDHSWVQSLVDEGKINDAQAAVHPHRSLLLRVLNGQPANDPDLTLVKVGVGDRLLLCSDGLCGLVDDPVIERAMRLPQLEDALGRLVDEALAEGGIDNITVVLADVVETAAEAPPVVLGAAAERKIPPVETRLRDADPGGRGRSEGTPGGGEPVRVASVGSRPGGKEASQGQGSEAIPALTAPVTTAPATGQDPDSPPPAPDGQADAVGDDEERYSPQPPRKRRLVRPLVGVLVLVLIAGAGLGAAYAWTRTQFFVGAANDKVAIFQGLSDGLPGLPLSRLYEVQPLSVSQLPPYYRERVEASIDVASLAAARQTVSELTVAARRCAALSPAPGPPARTPGTATTPRPTLTTMTPRATTPRPGTPGATAPKASGPSTAVAGRTGSSSPRVTPSASSTATPEMSC